MKSFIDFRSDTVTRPTERMRKAMAEAEVGDDVLREDPTVNRLEARAAEILGKEAALFVPSGTFGNQAALFTHCTRGNEVILSDACHIVEHEAGAASILASVQLRTVESNKGWLSWADIEPRIRAEKNIHYPDTGCIALENALSSGGCQPLDEAEAIYAGAGRYGVPVHLDGARIFNAAAALGVDAARIAAAADSVMFCLSKGLSSPVGSLLVGTGDFIEAARVRRKIMGGGMRQTGILAAAGLVSLDTMLSRLIEDHATAARLREILLQYSEFRVLEQDNPINMVFFRLAGDFTDGFDGTGTEPRKEVEARFLEACKRKGYLTYAPEGGWFRFVTHREISGEDVENFAGDLPGIIESVLG